MNDFKLNGQTKFIPQWIINENLTSNQIYAIRAEGESADLVRETEKAVLVSWWTEFGKVQMWCPMSVLTDEDEEQKKAEAYWTNFEDRMNKYEHLVEVAKTLDCGVRKNMKVITIVDKVREAGKFDAIANLVKVGKSGYYCLA